MVPNARETVSVYSVASGRRSAPSPPSGHRRRRGHLGPDKLVAPAQSGLAAGFLFLVTCAPMG